MTENTHTQSQLRSNKLRLGTGPALLILVFALSYVAPAATIHWTSTVTGTSAATGQPPNLHEEFTGSGVVTPFGAATYSDSGTLTLGAFPSGAFGPMLLKVDYVFSFNEGADTFFGKTVVNFGAPDNDGVQITTATTTIDGGTGMFTGATGSGIGNAKASPPPPEGASPITTFGSGEITAPGLTAVPEPATRTLLCTGFVAVIGLAALRKKTSGLNRA
jgi:hypothetical protein